MPKKSRPEVPEQPVYLTIPREEAAERIAARIAKGEELKSRPIQNASGFESAQKEYWTWTEYNEELLRQMFTGPKVADEYRGFSFGFAGDRGLAEEIRCLHESINDSIRRLASIRERLELFPLAPKVERHAAPGRASSDAGSRKVFVVHGHDEAARESAARFLSKLDLTPVILHEQASEGRTVVEKLERHGEVAFAIVLLTPDDVGGSDPNTLRPRARQNVVLELGYFVGRLGRERVCALYKGDLELPSDYMGVAYVPLDTGGGWRLLLAKELKAAGLAVDLNKAL